MFNLALKCCMHETVGKQYNESDKGRTVEVIKSKREQPGQVVQKTLVET